MGEPLMPGGGVHDPERKPSGVDPDRESPVNDLGADDAPHLTVERPPQDSDHAALDDAAGSLELNEYENDFYAGLPAEGGLPDIVDFLSSWSHPVIDETGKSFTSQEIASTMLEIETYLKGSPKATPADENLKALLDRIPTYGALKATVYNRLDFALPIPDDAVLTNPDAMPAAAKPADDPATPDTPASPDAGATSDTATPDAQSLPDEASKTGSPAAPDAATADSPDVPLVAPTPPVETPPDAAEGKPDDAGELEPELVFESGDSLVEEKIGERTIIGAFNTREGGYNVTRYQKTGKRDHYVLKEDMIRQMLSGQRKEGTWKFEKKGAQAADTRPDEPKGPDAPVDAPPIDAPDGKGAEPKTDDAPKGPETPVPVEPKTPDAPGDGKPPAGDPKPEPKSEPKPEQRDDIFKEENLLKELELFGISKADMEKVEGYAGLSLGQKWVMLENFKQSAVGRIHEDSARSLQMKTSKAAIPKRLWMAIVQPYFLSKERKAQASAIEKGGIAEHGETLMALAQGMAEFGPEVAIVDGALETQFINTKEIVDFEKMSDEEKEIISEYNHSANSFSMTPYEWSLSTASGSERRKYARAEKMFIEARDALRLANAARVEDQKKPTMDIFGADEQVRLQQMLNQHQDVEQTLLDIKSDRSWKPVLKTMASASGKGLYFAGGFAARSAAVGLLGTLGAPVMAAGIGGINGWLRSKKELLEQDRLARKGLVTNKETARNVVAADKVIEKKAKEGEEQMKEIPVGLSNKLDALMARIAQAPDGSDEKKKLMVSLKARMDYTDTKINNGLVSFGTGAESIAGKFSLAESLAKANMVLEIEKPNAEVVQSLNTRIDRYLARADKKIDQKRWEYTKKNIKKGALWAGIISGAGVGTRAIAEHYHWLDGATAWAKDHMPFRGGHAHPHYEATPVTPGSEPYVPTTLDTHDYLHDAEVLHTHPEWEGIAPDAATQGVANDGSVEAMVHEAVAKSAAESVPAVHVEIHEGEGMIKALTRSLEEQHHLDHEKAAELANQLYVSDADRMYDLVHAGDTFDINLKDVHDLDFYTKSAAELAKSADYDPSHFESASGIEPQMDLPDIAHHAEIPAATPDHAVHAVDLNAAKNAPHFANAATEKYFSDHGVRYDQETGNLFFNHDNHILTYRIKDHLAGYDNTLSVDTDGNYHLTQTDGHSTRVFSFDKDGQILPSASPHVEQPIAPKAPENFNNSLVVEGRGAAKLLDRKMSMNKMLDYLESTHPGLHKKLDAMSALEAAGRKGAFVKHLESALGITKSEASKLAKPIRFIFEHAEKGFKAGGEPLESDDTIGATLDRLKLEVK